MAKKAHPKTSAPKTATSPIVPVRDIAPSLKIRLFTKAGGRCEFDGCRRYLLEHPVTHKEGVFAEVAHIVAFSVKGPRSGDGVRPDNINDIANLMLLCPQCHKAIDDDERAHPRDLLEKHKREHEQLIRHLTSLMPSARTAVAVFTAPINGQSVGVPYDHVTLAVAPRYPFKREVAECNLSSLDGELESPEFLTLTKRKVDAFAERLFRQGEDVSHTQHLSVFALAPMSLLAYFGSKLSNKVPTDLFQRHRDTENWSWKADGEIAQFALQKLQDKGSDAPVVLKLSLSGSNNFDHYPDDLRTSATIYEISFSNRDAAPTSLRRKEDLERFRVVYQEFLATVLRDHPKTGTVALLPAVPPPVAVLCGRELLPKAHPAMRVFDFVKSKGKFVYHLTVNE